MYCSFTKSILSKLCIQHLLTKFINNNLHYSFEKTPQINEAQKVSISFLAQHLDSIHSSHLEEYDLGSFLKCLTT